MGLLRDFPDPTAALFLNTHAVAKAAELVVRAYPKRVSHCVARLRTSRGERLGYVCLVHFTDRRPPTALTNSDFERLTGA